MIEYDSGVPMPVIMGISIMECVIIFVFYCISINNIQFLRKASWCLFCGYLFLVFCSTVLYREENEKMRCYLFPLWSYTMLYNRVLAQNILNIILFIPIGFLGGTVVKHSNILKILKMGCFLSIAIETSQLFLKRGVCNMDDVIHNTIGCIIGYGIYRGCIIVIKKMQQMPQG